MSSAPEERLPKDFGKYRLVRRIATGGMAEIFLAHDRNAPGEPLVIKRILPHLIESSEFVSMFLDEARIAARLSHPNIVQIHDLGQIDGAYYIAMEYVHGEDIRRIYNRAYKLQRSLPLSHSIRVVAEAALGLGFAHKIPDLSGRPAGVVHRDVSPQNILVTYEGGVKIVDFGIAKAANKVSQTRAGVLKGKYSYMSPEQAMGDPIDHRTDIFALGIILYETTTGTRLFKRHNELSTLQAVIRCEVTPPSDALNGYPVELEQIVLRALAKKPSQRYQSAEDLSKDLYYFLETSGLFVESNAIAAFMADLFAERLEEERALGEPVLPAEHEVKEELHEATSASADDSSSEADSESSEQSASASASASASSQASDIREEDLEDEREDAESAVDATRPSMRDGSDSRRDPNPTANDRRGNSPAITAEPRIVSRGASKGSPGRRGSAAASKRGAPGFLDDDLSSVAGGTVPEEDLEDVESRGKKAARAESAAAAAAAAGAGKRDKEKSGARHRAAGNGKGPGPSKSAPDGTIPSPGRITEPDRIDHHPKGDQTDREKTEGGEAPDLMPTVAMTPAYRDESQAAPPEKAQTVLKVENTEHVRVRRPGQERDGKDKDKDAKDPKDKDGRGHHRKNGAHLGAVPSHRVADGPRGGRGRHGDKGKGPPIKAMLPWIIAAFAIAVAIGVVGAFTASRRRAALQQPLPPVNEQGPESAQQPPPPTPRPPEPAPPAPAPAPQPPAVAAGPTGEVIIVTEPGAEISTVAGVLGVADDKGRSGPHKLPAGPQTVIVRLASKGFSRERPVEVRPNQIHEIEIRARQGWLKLAVAPWAKVTVDGQTMGITPLPNLLLDEGTHHVVLENPDVKRRHDSMIKVEAGQVSDLKLDLLKLGDPM